MNLLIYVFVFFAALLVDIIPLAGPPAWILMVFFQVRYHLNIWLVLIIGVTGSAVGRYLYSLYIPLLANKFINKQKNEDIQFIGERLKGHGWKVQLFVLLYTLLPLPSTPLFTVAGIAKIKTIYIMPAFFIGKFISDAMMVFAGNYVATSLSGDNKGFLSWKNVTGTAVSLVIIFLFLFIDWRRLLQKKKFRFSFNIWK